MLLNNRHGSVDSDAYRYGFQGQERDDEVKDAGNSYNYKYRMHDPRLGRFFSRDLMEDKLPSLTTYGFVNGNPLRFIDPDGNFLIDVHKRITKNAFSKIDAKKLKLTRKQQRDIVSFRKGIVGNGISYFDGSVVAPDVRSLPWYAGGDGEPSNEHDHFDNMTSSEILLNFTETFEDINIAMVRYKADGKVRDLAKVVGEQYHAIQDFYSHSNYIEIYKEVYGETEMSKIPTLQEVLNSDEYSVFAEKLNKELKTGVYPGTNKDSHKAMNKDLGKGSVFSDVTPEVEGEEVNWNSRAAETIATKATKEINDRVEKVIIEND